MSQANSAIHGPYRRKVTLACGSCRKRRVKCSGSQPCTQCSESNRLCEFDNKNRARRGPRPRQATNLAQRIIHQLAPRLPSSDEPVAISPSRVAVESTWQPQQEIQVTGERCVTDDDYDDDEDDDDTADGDDALDPTAWKPGLEDLFYSNDSISNTLPTLHVDLICHLIDIFCTRANAQLRLLLPPAQIQQHLSQGTISRGLVLAICASSLRFTVHKAAKGPHGRGLAESIEREARKCIHSSRVSWQQVDNVRTICVLIDYEASRAHGRQAWIDIAMGRSLVQLARSACNLDAEQAQGLSVAERYLAIAQASHCLGHRYLQASSSRPAKRPRLECAPCPDDCPHLVELLEVLASIHQLCLTPFKEQNPLPWTADSEFRALQDELEEYLLRHPSTFRFGSNSPSSHSSRRVDLDASISSMVWHCCVIVLNRTFLPIPERPQVTPNGGQDLPVRCVEFPEAPPLFLQERIHRCESSADVICEITRDVIRNGGFYSHALLVGFACTQSALVSINRLHRSSKLYDDRIVENLKLAFVVLGALKTFYAPAKDWMEVLFRAHDANTRLRHASETIDLAFNSYFSRFLDIEEPAFMPLDPKDGDTPGDAGGDNEPGGIIEPETEGRVGSQEQRDESIPANAGPGWLQAYAGHLSGDIDTDDEMDAADNSPRSSAVYIEPRRRTTGTMAQTQVTPLSTVKEVQGQGIIMNMEPHGSESPVHLAGAILTSMSGRTPNFTLQAQEPQPEESHPACDRSSTAVDANDPFSSFLSQMPTFAEFAELSPGMSIFPGLGPGIDGSDMWSEIFNHNMLK